MAPFIEEEEAPSVEGEATAEASFVRLFELVHQVSVLASDCRELAEFLQFVVDARSYQLTNVLWGLGPDAPLLPTARLLQCYWHLVEVPAAALPDVHELRADILKKPGGNQYDLEDVQAFLSVLSAGGDELGLFLGEELGPYMEDGRLKRMTAGEFLSQLRLEDLVAIVDLIFKEGAARAFQILPKCLHRVYVDAPPEGFSEVLSWFGGIDAVLAIEGTDRELPDLSDPVAFLSELLCQLTHLFHFCIDLSPDEVSA